VSRHWHLVSPPEVQHHIPPWPSDPLQPLSLQLLPDPPQLPLPSLPVMPLLMKNEANIAVSKPIFNIPLTFMSLCPFLSIVSQLKKAGPLADDLQFLSVSMFSE